MLNFLRWSAMHSTKWHHIRLQTPIGVAVRKFRLAGYIGIELACWKRPVVSYPGICWLEYLQSQK